jgi:hypothetical protein
MSMSHKAFVFDYRRFAEELRGLLLDALRSGDCEPIRSLIVEAPSAFRDPYEGEPLDSDWESLIATKDAHQYGDFALTKYYDPVDDIGVNGDWMELDDVLAEHGLSALLLGEPLGSRDAGGYFDPGKMGSYFQTESGVRENLLRLEQLERQHPDLVEKMRPVRAMLERAVRAGHGIYATF